MPAKLFCRTGELAGRDYVIDGNATIGSASQNTVVLPHRMVSRHHARITFDGADGVWVLEDLQSRNGTRLDNVPLKGREKLGPLHVITLAERHDFIFQIEVTAKTGPRADARKTDDVSDVTAAQAEATTQPYSAIPTRPQSRPPVSEGTILADASDLQVPVALGAARADASTIPADPTYGELSSFMMPPVLRSDDDATVHEAVAGEEAVTGWYLEVQSLAAGPSRYPLPEGTCTIGRAAGCDVRLDDPSVSRRHAVITVKSGSVTVTDLESANGTFAHDAPVTNEVEGHSGMTLRFGDIVATLVQKT